MVEKPTAGPLKILFTRIDTHNPPEALATWKLYLIRYMIDDECITEGRIWLPGNFDPKMIPYMIHGPSR